jgi:hypothetical protein
MKKPDFFIVGAPKCGTTAMHHYLKQHPEIFMPDVKEIHFFGSDLRSSYARINEPEYLSYFQAAKQQKRIGDTSVLYLYSKRAAYEINKFAPSANIIVMLRNPVDLIYSAHSQMVYNGNEDIEDFEAALEAEENRKKGLNLPKHFIESIFYRETVKYTEQLTRYIDIFGRENVHIIIFDDFIQDTALIFRETLRFLGVDEDFCPPFEKINANKKIRSRLLGKILKNPPKPVQWFARLMLSPSIRHKLYSKAGQMNTLHVQRPTMAIELRRQLQAEFLPEIEMLSQLLERDLTYWCNPNNHSGSFELNPTFGRYNR